MASCTRPSTADDDASSGSSLSTPPASPSRLPISSTTADEPAKEPEDVEKELPKDRVRQLDLEVVNQPTIDGQKISNQTVAKDPCPYINPMVGFDYYDQSEPQEGSDADGNPPEPTDKFPFPKVTDIEVFEEYLKNAEDMSYDELYRRTAIVSDNLVVYQAEWDTIDKEIFEHETYLRSEEKRIEEETKAAVEEDRLIEDEERDRVEEDFKDQLKLTGKKWQEFLSNFESEHPSDTNTLRHLQNLRNPQFMAAARKKKRTAENKHKNLLNSPWPEVKKTKEDLEIEKRKRGRYMDPVKFDDMKQADVYGFEYSAHIKHYGQQPMAIMTRQIYPNSNPTSHPFGDDTNDASRTRTQRKQTRKVYEAEASVTPEDSETDAKLPLKRARKPKIFIDGVETLERSRGQSRSGTPAVRTFASGKRVGRPPAKSKLQAVQLAQPSETPEVGSGSEAQVPDGVGGLIQDNDAGSRQLAPSQEAQLHDAAESLVNQTHNNQVSATLPVAKPKHPGGRPRKIRKETSTSTVFAEVPTADIPQPKPRHPGGRPRKRAVPMVAEYQAFDTEEPQVFKVQPKKRGGRRIKKETIPDEDLQLGEENGVLQSTEQDDGSQYSSAATTRPTTSDSNATVSTFASRRSARPSTRDKTNAREARAATVNRRNSILEPTISAPTSGRSKRKRNSSDTDPSPIVVQPAFIPSAEPATKKRRTRTKQGSDDVIEALPGTIPEASTGRSKRKRGDTINESIAVVGPPSSIDFAPAPKKRRRRVKQGKPVEPEVEEEDSDAGIDEESLDPIAREALRKKRVKKEKSRKLSKNMKARWASGGMKEAQETRKTNNAIKRSWKQQALANEAAGLPPPPPPVLIGTAPNFAAASAPAQNTEPGAELDTPVETPAMTTPSPATKSTKKRSRGKPAPLKRPASTRTKRPTRVAMGLDGADDDDDEIDQQFASEYDRYQALTSPKRPIVLGKRVRKSLVDLSQLMDDSEDDDF